MRRRFFLISLVAEWMTIILVRPKYTIAYNDTTAPLIPLIKAIYTEMGMQPFFELVPSERAIALTDSGYYDADLCRVDSVVNNYPNLRASHEALKELTLYAYARRQSGLQVDNLSEFKQLKVGLIHGSKLAEDFVSQQGLHAIKANSVDSFYKMFKAKRFDIALISSTQLISQSQQLTALAEQVGPVLMRSFSYHIVHKRHASLLTKFDVVLKRMRSDGRLTEY